MTRTNSQVEIGAGGVQNSRNLFLALCLILCSYLMPAPAQAEAQAQTPDMRAIKQALLDDMLFLSQLRDRLSVASMDEEGVRTIVRNYLIDNPELILEVQQILHDRQEMSQNEMQQEMASTITHNADFLFNNQDDLILGNREGDVTLVEFYDYNCGYCKSSHPGNLALLEKDKNIKLVMKDYPILGEDSARAHIVAQAFKKLMPEKYPAFHHEMMTRQTRATWDSTIEVALSHGADKELLLQTTQEESLQAPLVETAKIAYQLGINFTPAYIVGTEILRGAVDEVSMRAVVSAQREQAQAEAKE